MAKMKKLSEMTQITAIADNDRIYVESSSEESKAIKRINMRAKMAVGTSTAIADTNTALSNGSVNLNIIEDEKVISSHNIKGTDGTTVTATNNGNLEIHTKYTISNTDSTLKLTSGYGGVTQNSEVEMPNYQITKWEDTDSNTQHQLKITYKTTDSGIPATQQLSWARYIHPSSFTQKTTAGFYKYTVNSNGHVTAGAALAKTDITALGIPGENTNTDTTYTNSLSWDNTNHRITLGITPTTNDKVAGTSSTGTKVNTTLNLSTSTAITQNDNSFITSHGVYNSLTTGGVSKIKVGNNVELRTDGEGGNLKIIAPDNSHYMEMDMYNNTGWRIYFGTNAQEVTGQILMNPSTTVDLNSLASQSWVNNQNFATQSWVNGKGYIAGSTTTSITESSSALLTSGGAYTNTLHTESNNAVNEDDFNKFCFVESCTASNSHRTQTAPITSGEWGVAQFFPKSSHAMQLGWQGYNASEANSKRLFFRIQRSGSSWGDWTELSTGSTTVSTTSTVTSGSSTPITSGGVYAALGNRSSISVTTTPSSGSGSLITSGGVYTALGNRSSLTYQNGSIWDGYTTTNVINASSLAATLQSPSLPYNTKLKFNNNGNTLTTLSGGWMYWLWYYQYFTGQGNFNSSTYSIDATSLTDIYNKIKAVLITLMDESGCVVQSQLYPLYHTSTYAGYIELTAANRRAWFLGSGSPHVKFYGHPSIFNANWTLTLFNANGAGPNGADLEFSGGYSYINSPMLCIWMAY